MKIIADLHTHTVASTHAFSTVTENAKAASEAGIKYLATTEHGIEMPDSPHLWCFYSMRNIPRQLFGVNMLRGMEANIINYEGSIDIYEKEIYSCLDWIVASYHHPCCMPGTKAQHTNSYIKALENPYIDCIGHSDDPDYDYEFKPVCEAAKAYDKAIELNASRLRSKRAQERYREILAVCAQVGAKICVNSDAHFWDRIGNFEQATAFLEETGFPEELVLNASEERFLAHLSSHRGNPFE